jgi:hypothetical protein
MSKWKRILIALGIVVVFAAVYLPFFGVQTMCALTVRYWYRKTPDVAKTPVVLKDLSVSDVPHRKLSYFGYEFEIPWDDLDEQKGKTVGTIHVSYFHSGNVFWFSSFPPKEFVNGIMKDAKLDSQDFRNLYGDDAFESDYGFHRKMLETTPSEITPFVSRRQAVAGEMLLLVKAVSMPKAESGIFSIQTPNFQGFQFESPQGRPFRITDELYSNDGGIDLIFLQKLGGSAPSISQGEINRIIQSVHKLPTSAVTLKTIGHNK